jgi:hypothetical protein
MLCNQLFDVAEYAHTCGNRSNYNSAAFCSLILDLTRGIAIKDCMERK